ncbi:MAG: 2-oxoacid:acceptor oxidoreductase subunit alpha, partial [Candidatus Omnitrophota bacterium]|nr:2-oxoacid:acceptor oxidoreductase subunit alpha [Candidatus Omnitrophota bacterium]
MTDQHLADSSRDIEPFDMNKITVKRSIISREDSKKISGYKRYQLTDSGISPRAIPSWISDVIYVDSDEHNEEGHITEAADMRIKMVEKRFYKKMAALSDEVEAPTAYNTDKAEIVLAGYGSTYGVMKEACGSSKGGKIGFVHFSQVWPFPSKKSVEILKNAKKIITVENNAAGQLARLMRRESGITASDSVLRFDGRPFDLDYLMGHL